MYFVRYNISIDLKINRGKNPQAHHSIGVLELVNQ